VRCLVAFVVAIVIAERGGRLSWRSRGPQRGYLVSSSAVSVPGWRQLVAHLVVPRFRFRSHSRPWSVRLVAFVVAVVVAEMGVSGGRWLG